MTSAMVTIETKKQAAVIQPTTPEGTVRHCGDATYLVKGRSDWYLCDANESTCECGDYLHRRAAKRERCRHLQMLAEHLACPACHGKGELGPVSDNGLVWLDKQTITCFVCEGTGLRGEGQEPERKAEELADCPPACEDEPSFTIYESALDNARLRKAWRKARADEKTAEEFDDAEMRRLFS